MTDIFLPSTESLLSKIKRYRLRAAQLKAQLEKQPEAWGRYQSEFNQEVNSFFRDIMNYEKVNLAVQREQKLYKLKQFFVQKLRPEFLFGQYIVWSLRKPYGYAGDFKIIDDIYRNDPVTQGFDRLYDNYFQMASISVAVRNRKEDFKRMIQHYAVDQNHKALAILDVASGPCRGVKELLTQDTLGLFKQSRFVCLDADLHAIDYARQLLQKDPRVQFQQMNVIRLALTKSPEKIVEPGFDVIYSTGLFDYLDERVSVRLIQNLKRLLKPGGILAVSDVRDKFSNPSVYFMEWVGDWNLVYRDDEVFRQFFLDGGFRAEDLRIEYEQQGILQYVIAKHSG